jgi:hypothetical protein
VADLTTAADLATAAGTLVLALATFSAVRSGRRSAVLAEQALQAGVRPFLTPSKLSDDPLPVTFGDRHLVWIKGGRGTAELAPDAIYLTMSLRNAGQGPAVLHSWTAADAQEVSPDDTHRPLGEFRRLSRDIFVPPGDIGFWQGAIRGIDDPLYEDISAAVRERGRIMIDVLYGDSEGGQRAVTRFLLQPLPAGAEEPPPDRPGKAEQWMTSIGRHWNIDRPDPR